MVYGRVILRLPMVRISMAALLLVVSLSAWTTAVVSLSAWATVYEPSSLSCAFCDLHGANLSGADLTGANIGGADLTDADLTDADLTGANLTGANLRRRISQSASRRSRGTPVRPPKWPQRAARRPWKKSGFLPG